MNPVIHAAQLRNYQQANQRPPHSTAGRRGPGPMIGGSHSVAAPSQAQLAAQRQQLDMAESKRRAKIPTDKNIPEGVEDTVIGDGVQHYRDLREIERKLDSVMMRKRLDLQDRNPQSQERIKTLRIWISNTVQNQPWQGSGLEEIPFDFSTGMDSTYKVKIEGRVLDDEDSGIDSEEEDDLDLNTDSMDVDGQDEAAKAQKARSNKPRQRFSHFFKSITVEYDRVKNPQSSEVSAQIEWKKPAIIPNSPNLPAAADFDSLEFERKSDENINCTINLYRDENPERFLISKELSGVVGMKEGTRNEIETAILRYVSAMSLMRDDEKRIAFKNDTIYFPQLAEMVLGQISSLPPVKLPYTIRVDPEYHNNPVHTIYDIKVPAQDSMHAKMIAVVQKAVFPATLRQIAVHDEQVALIVQKLNTSKAKHAFYTSMSKDPATFVRRWVSSQRRDLEVILGEATRGGDESAAGEEFRRGGKDGVWGSEHLRQSVGLMMARDRGSKA